MRAMQRPLCLSLTNASALLWRLDTLGCDIGERWRELADLWQDHADGKCLVFGDIHAANGRIALGQEALVEQRPGAMRETAAGGLEAAGFIATSAFRWSSCCCRWVSVYGRSVAATRNATSSTGP